ncbi:MAG: 3-phosphoshikimate 1-carboxyvinyltransferase [Proteobacteria bacterium]|nr:3-phosphoshikimate 1-carboxyvinyltransferase [Pseudomonadota bacterium]MBI3498521.1 3-phosphoshikimate 1-carboxyvinyltransferase [Pseudomonadota bacterium]
MRKVVARPSNGLSGRLAVPGDKSISHRSLMIGGIAVGETKISGLLEGEDVLNTAESMRRLGCEVDRGEDGVWHVHGLGLGGLKEPAQVLDFGNSGTGARLLIGLLAGHPFTSFFTGDASLRRRPMLRVTEPLSQMGARFVSREGGRLPLAVIGARDPMPVTYRQKVASAQVKSAILLAGLSAPGETTVIEPEPTRDHSEKMLSHFGAEIRVADTAEGRRVTLVGQPELSARPVRVPADPSSAAFPAVAALLVPGSRLELPNVGMNPLRDGLYRTLVDMGADIAFENRRMEAGEPVADLVVSHSGLKAVEVPAQRAPSMIDEYPVLAVAAAFAEGTTVMRGLAELRVKESDRLAAVVRGLTAAGIEVEASEDTLRVKGRAGANRPPRGGAVIAAALDHRIAMAFLVLGLVSEKPITIDDGTTISTSFPNFIEAMARCGAAIAWDEAE